MQITASAIIAAINASGRTISEERAENLARFCNGRRSLDAASEALSWADHLGYGFNRHQLESDLFDYRQGLAVRDAA